MDHTVSAASGVGNATQELVMTRTVRGSSLEHYLISDREEAVRKVQGQMSDLHQLFADVAELTRCQGERLENIEASLENAKVFPRPQAAAIVFANNETRAR
jgi:hypothetical protein